MSERTTSRVIPRLDANDSIPLLTEVVELPAEAGEAPAAPQQAPEAAQSGVIDTADMAPGGMATFMGDMAGAEVAQVADAGEPEPAVAPAQGLAAQASDPPGEDDLRAVRAELLTRVMMRFRTEWPQVVEAQTEATLQAQLAPLTRQLAAELTQALEARLVEWLDATLAEIERDPGGV